MADAAPKKAAPVVAEKPAEKPPLARASESGDPAVHQLLAERQIHEANGDEEKAADATHRLADLGFE